MAITFARCSNLALIRAILTHPLVYPHISDDGSPEAEEYQPIDHPAIWYVLARDVAPEQEDILGVWMFTPQNAVCWEVHTALMPIAYGMRALNAARMLPEWIWENTPCRRIVSTVPTTNRLALYFAVDAGMKIYGVNEASWLKNGRRCDQVCFGLSAPRELGDNEAETAPDSIESIPVGPEEEV